MKKKGWIISVLVLVLCAGIGIHDRSSRFYELTGVSDAIRMGNLIYIIDNNGDAYNLFAIEENGRITGRIDLPKLEGTWWNAYSSLTADRDGQVYVYGFGKSMDSSLRRSIVYRCDFKEGRLEEVCRLPDDQAIGIQAVDGAIYYTGAADGRQTGLYRKTLDGGSEDEAECLLLLNVPSEQMKDFFYDPARGLWWADWICRFYLDEKEIRYETSEKCDYVNLSVDAGGLRFVDLEAGSVEWINPDTWERQPLYAVDDVRLMNRELEYQDILPLHYQADGSMLAGIDVAEDRRILGIFNRAGKQTAQYDVIQTGSSMRMASAFRCVCLCLTLCLAAVGLIKAGLWWTKGTIPIVVQLLGVLIPLVILSSMALQDKMERSLETRIMKMNYDLLYNMADQRLSIMNPEELRRIDLQHVPEDPVYQRIFRSEDYSVLKKTIYSRGTGAAEPIVANTYQWMFLWGDGALRYTEVDGQHYYGIRVAYDRGRQEMEKMEQAMREQHIVKTQYNDFSGNFVALYVPVIDERGVSIGVMESGLNRRILTYEIRQQMNQIHRLLLMMEGVLIGMLLTVLGCFLYPLTRVKAAMEEVSRGNLGKVVRVRGRDEVAGIAAAFNHMSQTLKEQVEFIQKCSDGYAAFVPEKIFEILGKEDITQVELGNQKEVEAAVLQIGSRQFRNEAKSMTGEVLYRKMNRILREMIPLVTREDGIVDHMAEDGLTAYYPEESGRALQTAVSICEKLNWLRGQGEEIPVYRMAVHYGTIRVGIVGQEERMEASTISEVLTLAGFLQEMGERYGTRILVMESAAAGIPEFKNRFHARMIGYLYIRMTGRMEAVYEVYDGDEGEQWRRKEETAELFQKALADYLAERYYNARLAFARILRSNPRDLVARAYVYRCDEYYQAAEKGKLKVWLEEY